MKRCAPWILALLLWATHVLFAAETHPMTVTVEMGEGGTERLRFDAPGFPTNASPDEVMRYIHERVWPTVQAEANQEIQPAVWQRGYFYLNGWGVARDLKRAEAAFRAGPSERRTRGLWRVGSCYLWDQHDPANAEPLFREALKDGSAEAVKDTALLARAHVFGWWKLPRDKARAESLLQQAGAVAPEDADYLLSLACLRIEQGRYAEGYSLASQVAPRFQRGSQSYRLAVSRRVLGALRAGTLSEIQPEEMLEVLQGMNVRSNGLLGAVLAAVLLVLAGLVWWTYGTRQRGPGLWLSGCWIGVLALVAALGFLLPLPSVINNAAGRWSGAILLAAVCLISTQMIGRARYFGTTPLVTDVPSARRIVGRLMALLAGLLAAGTGYQFLYQQITGHPLDSQLVAALLKCASMSDFVVTLAVAGLLIPFYEEVVFRGFLFGAIERRWGSGWALAGSAAVFALIHGLTHAPLLLCIGLALGWLRQRTGDLRQSILLHCLNNTLAMLAIHWGATP